MIIRGAHQKMIMATHSCDDDRKKKKGDVPLFGFENSEAVLNDSIVFSARRQRWPTWWLSRELSLFIIYEKRKSAKLPLQEARVSPSGIR